MNESDLENELRKFRPVAPSAHLEQAIARELTAQTPRTLSLPRSSGKIIRREESAFVRLLSGFCWAGAGATAAVIVNTCLNLWQTPPPVTQLPATDKSENVFEPAESYRRLLAAEAKGFIYTEQQQPSRVVRYNSMERYIWANPATGARMEVEVPREDVVLVPVSFQ